MVDFRCYEEGIIGVRREQGVKIEGVCSALERRKGSQFELCTLIYLFSWAILPFVSHIHAALPTRTFALGVPYQKCFSSWWSSPHPSDLISLGISSEKLSLVILSEVSHLKKLLSNPPLCFLHNTHHYEYLLLIDLLIHSLCFSSTWMKEHEDKGPVCFCSLVYIPTA